MSGVPASDDAGFTAQGACFARVEMKTAVRQSGFALRSSSCECTAGEDNNCSVEAHVAGLLHFVHVDRCVGCAKRAEGKRPATDIQETSSDEASDRAYAQVGGNEFQEGTRK